jgi:hypothetical protein
MPLSAGRSGRISEPGLPSAEIIAASESGSWRVEARSTLLAAATHNSTDAVAPSAGQSSRLSVTISRIRDANDCARSVRTRTSRLSVNTVNAPSSTSSAGRAADVARSEAPMRRMSSTRRAQVSHQRRCDSTAS